MSFAVLCLVVSAAFAHAGWNFVAKGAEGGAAFVWMSLVAGSLIYVPALVAALAIAPGPLGWVALGLMAGSGALHAVYFTLLQRGYATGDLSVVYPLARGTGPLLSTAAGIVLLDEHPGAAAIAGAATIVMAIFLLASPGTAGRAAIVFAVLTGVAIAAYTVWDKQAVDASALAPIVYYWGTNTIAALLLTPWVARPPRRPAAGVDDVAPPCAVRRAAEPARVRADPLRARPGAGELRRAGPRDEHRARHAARSHGAGGARRPAPPAGLGGDPARRRRARRRVSAQAARTRIRGRALLT